jgi:predicted site-specific integrase-resolvase
MQNSNALTVQETAAALQIRCHGVYALLRDGLLAGTKLDSGEWRVDSESVTRYAMRRAARRAYLRSTSPDRAINVTAMTVHAGT